MTALTFLALDLSVGECPNRARNSILVRNRVMKIFEGLRYQTTSVGIVAKRNNCWCVDILVVLAVKIELKSYISREIEIRVEGTRSMAGFNGGWSGEFVNVVGAGTPFVEAFLDAVAHGFDSRESEIDFSNYASDVETTGIANTAVVLCSEAGANALQPTFVVVITVVADGEWVGENANGKQRADESGRDMHDVGTGIKLKLRITKRDNAFEYSFDRERPSLRVSRNVLGLK